MRSIKLPPDWKKQGVIISYVALRIAGLYSRLYIAIDLSANSNVEVKDGYGRHLWEVTVGDFSNQLQMVSTVLGAGGKTKP